MTVSKYTFDEILAATEEHGNEEGGEAQIGDLVELAKALYEQLTPAKWLKCCGSPRMKELTYTLFYEETE